MANKRALKKQIRRVCGAIAGEIVSAAEYIDEMPVDKVQKIVNNVARLQVEALERASFSFDKSPKDFADIKEYRKAKREYNAKAFKTLRQDFSKSVEIIVKAMNDALPQEQKDANVKALKD